MKKIHLTKLENDQIEVGVQLRDEKPVVPKDNRIAFYKNTGEFQCRINEQDYSLSFDVVENDPTTPIEKQVWINETSNTLKWKFGGVVKSLYLGDKMAVSSSKSASEYNGIMNDAELESVSGQSNLSPKVVVDAFIDDLAEANFTNVVRKASALTVADGNTSGQYNVERRSSAQVNYVEGIVVSTAQGVAPFEVTDNGDGSTTLKFVEDLSDIFAVGSNFLVYEEEIVNDVVKGYHLLSNGVPAVFNITDYSFDDIERITTITVANNNLDLSLGFTDVRASVRLFPLKVEAYAGGEGSLGTMTKLEVLEAHTMDNVVRMIGDSKAFEFGNPFKDVYGRGVMDFAVNHSPNKKYWIIPMFMCRGTSDVSAVLHVYYSTDGLKTINRMNYEGELCIPAYRATRTGANVLGNSLALLSDAWTHVNDDGRFLFNRASYHGVTAYTHEFGHLNPADGNIWIRKSVAKNGSYDGIKSQEANTSYHYYSQANSDVDWNNNLTAWVTSKSGTEDHRVFFQLIDWNTKIDYAKGWATIGADHSEPLHSNSFCFFKHFEDEDMFFNANEHTNNHFYAIKIRVADILAVENNVSTNVAIYNAFSNSDEGGNRGDYSNLVHTMMGAGTKHYAHGWDEDDDRLMMMFADTTDAFIGYAVIDFGRTTAGKNSEHRIDTDAIPDNGTITLNVTDVATANTETTSPIPYSANNETIQSVIEGLTFVSTAIVTGDWETGFAITIEGKIATTLELNSNSFTDIDSNPVTVTTSTSEEGFQPRWLRLADIAGSSEIFTPERGGTVKMTVAGNLSYTSDYYASGDDSNVSGNQIRRQGQNFSINGKTILTTVSLREISNDNDTFGNYLIKIPDYTECYGRISAHENPDSVQAVSSDSTAVAGTIVMPDVPFSGALYPDGKIPFRTLSLYLRRNFNGLKCPTHCDGSPIMVSVKLVEMVDGLPSDNVLGVSKYKYPFQEITGYDNVKRHYFVFDDLKFDVGQEIGVVIDLGLTAEQQKQCGAVLDVYYQASAGGNGFYKQDGQWTRVDKILYHELFDFYMHQLHISHESGWNDSAYVGTSYNEHGCQLAHESMHPINDSKELFRGTYVHMMYPNNADEESFCKGPYNMYEFDISDNNGQYKLPTVGDAELTGKQGTDHDDKLVFTYFPLMDNYDFPCDEYMESIDYTSEVLKDTGYKVQLLTQVGNFPVSCDSALLRLKETPVGYLDYTDGQVLDDRFATGMATDFNGAGKLRVGPNCNMEYVSQPFEKDFILEAEILPLEADLSGNTMIYSQATTLYVGLWNNKYYFYSWNDTENLGTASYEDCPQDVYHRIRWVRKEDGLHLYRNFSKVGGTWEELQLGGESTVDGSNWANGYTVGHTTAQTWIAIGGYTEDATHNWNGLIGYTKLAINTHEFKYDGAKCQNPIITVRNKGDKMVGMEIVKDVFYGGTKTIDVQTKVKVLNNTETALVPTNDHILKYGETVSAGQKMAVKLELSKVSDNDASKVQGYTLGFDKK